MPTVGRAVLEILAVTPEIIEARETFVGARRNNSRLAWVKFCFCMGNSFSEREMGNHQ